MARIERDAEGNVRYAVVSWTPGDITSLRPSWTDEEAEDWLADNARYIEDAMCERGWEVIEDLLPSKKHEDEEDEDNTLDDEE